MWGCRVVVSLTMVGSVMAAAPDKGPDQGPDKVRDKARDGVKVTHLNSGKVFPEGLPFSEAVRVGDLLLLSGQLGLVPGSLKLVPGGIKQEARQALENIKSSLEANGYAMNDVVKCTVMLADIADWGEFNEIYKQFFAAPYPARSALGASGLALGARVEIECIAAKGR